MRIFVLKKLFHDQGFSLGILHPLIASIFKIYLLGGRFAESALKVPFLHLDIELIIFFKPLPAFLKFDVIGKNLIKFLITFLDQK